MTRQLKNQMRLGVGLMIALLVMVGCFQQASEGSLNATAVPQALPSATPTVTNTPLPATTTFTPMDTPEVTEPTAIAFSATETPTAQATEVAQQVATTVDPVIQEATDLIATETQEIIDLTRTAEITLVLPTATLTPQFTFTPTFTPSPDFGSGTGTGPDCVHQIRPGDNLFRLSQYYGVPIRTLQSANGIANPGLIIAGNDLVIPNCGTTGNRPPATIPGLDSGAGSGAGSGFGSAGGVQHVVEQGETLYQISLRYNVLIRDIQAANNIANPNLIYFNQTLTIP